MAGLERSPSRRAETLRWAQKLSDTGPTRAPRGRNHRQLVQMEGLQAPPSALQPPEPTTRCSAAHVLTFQTLPSCAQEGAAPSAVLDRLCLDSRNAQPGRFSQALGCAAQERASCYVTSARAGGDVYRPHKSPMSQ